MSDWTPVCPLAELAPGAKRTVDVDGALVLVVNVGGELHAVEDVCTHDGGELAGGPIDGFAVECPRHGAKFDLRSGEALCAPAYTPIEVFPVKREDGAIWTRDDRGD